MCGICGQYNFAGGDPVRLDTIKRMMGSIVHRGPDDEGVFLAGPLGFGFRRLSIIDLAGGHQPMSDQSQSVWVVFNGEIYNFKELRAELESSGHVFRTNSDTEVIIHGYKQWGDEVLDRLNGMFGLAIWDVEKQRLVLARDPFGIKSVYYKIDEGRLYFGSEVRAVRHGKQQKTQVDPVSLNLFLRYRYTPSPYTLFKGIRKLPPGSKLVAEKGACRVSRWHRSKPGPVLSAKSDVKAREELLDLYKKAVQKHLISDVPVGLLLSGGIDSGLLLALMNLYGKSWPTYTVGYGESYADDELADGAETARVLGSNHTSVTVTRSMFEAALPKIVSCLEEPVATSSIVPMYFVCERAKQDVKAALIGQGPDELFGGYRRHLGIRYGGLWRDLPRVLRKPVTSLIGVLPRNETLKRGLYSLDISDRMKRYQNVLSIMPGDSIDGLFKDEALPVGTGDKILDCWDDLNELMGETDELGGFQFLEVRSTLPDELLMYADKLSMAHSLELRVPYLDKEVVQYAERLPAHFKVRGRSQKWLHRQVCEAFLPPSFMKRKKRGFAGNVVDGWFRGTMNSRMNDAFMDEESGMYQYLKPQAVQQLYRDHAAGRHDHHKILFSLIVFEEWLRVNEGNPAQWCMTSGS
ncbi:MAG: asparagine synthase (glutamine-hydrolyzing) [Nitrospira sp.]|nr:asparagine synthase (glutamine-hydrolyzing) [Nitrospira sp.]